MKLLGNTLLGLAPLSISFLFIDFSKCLFFLFRQRFKTVSKAWKILANVYSEHTGIDNACIHTHSTRKKGYALWKKHAAPAGLAKDTQIIRTHTHTHTQSHACTYWLLFPIPL